MEKPFTQFVLLFLFVFFFYTNINPRWPPIQLIVYDMLKNLHGE